MMNVLHGTELIDDCCDYQPNILKPCFNLNIFDDDQTEIFKKLCEVMDVFECQNCASTNSTDPSGLSYPCSFDYCETLWNQMGGPFASNATNGCEHPGDYHYIAFPRTDFLYVTSMILASDINNNTPFINPYNIKDTYPNNFVNGEFFCGNNFLGTLTLNSDYVDGDLFSLNKDLANFKISSATSNNNNNIEILSFTNTTLDYKVINSNLGGEITLILTNNDDDDCEINEIKITKILKKATIPDPEVRVLNKNCNEFEIIVDNSYNLEITDMNIDFNAFIDGIETETGPLSSIWCDAAMGIQSWINDGNGYIFIPDICTPGVTGTVTIDLTYVNECGESFNRRVYNDIELCDPYPYSGCFNSVETSHDTFSCNVNVNLDIDEYSYTDYLYIVTNETRATIMDYQTDMHVPSFQLDVSEYPTGNYRLHLFCRNGEYSNSEFKVVDNDKAKISIEEISPCDFTYNIINGDKEFDIYWQDPDGDIVFKDSIINANKNGKWKAFIYNEYGCPFDSDSILLTNCEVKLSDLLCTNINDDASGTGDWSNSYTSDGNGILQLLFNTLTVPDQLIVQVNGVEVVNSGFYSSNLCDSNYKDCQGTVNYGCGVDFMADIPISYNDIIDINVYGNTCNATGTAWSLLASCDTLPLEDRIINQIDDDENFNKEIYLYPNPTNKDLNIFINEKYLPCTIEILDITNKSKLNLKIINTFTKINVTEYKSGSYILKVNTIDHVFAKKFIIY